MSERLIVSAFEYLIKNEEETAPIFKQEIFEETLKLLRQQQEKITELETAVQALKAEKEKLKAIAAAELDTIHALGEDYERLLEEQAEMVRKAEIESLIGITLCDGTIPVFRSQKIRKIHFKKE